MTDNPDTPRVSFIDNPHAPDVFADSVTGFFNFNGNLRLTFEAFRVDHSSSPGPVNRIVIGRLVLPLSAAKGLHAMLTDFFEKQSDETPPVEAQGTPTLQ